MENNVDELNIVLTGEDKSGTKTLDNLIKKLETIKTVALASNKSLGTIAANFEKIAAPFEKLNGARIGQFAQSLSYLKNIRIPASLSSRLDRLGQSVEALNSVDVSGLRRIRTELSAIGSMGETKLPQINTPKIPEMPQVKDFSGSRPVAPTTEERRPQVETKPDTQNLGDTTKVEQTTEAAKKVSSSANSAANAAAKASKTITKSVSPAITIFSRLGNTAKRAFGVVKSALSGMGNAAIKAGSTIVSSLGRQITKPFRSMGNVISNAAKKVKGFMRSIARIAIYRAVRSMIKGITKAFKEGIANVYQYSKAINGDFAKSMDKLSTSALYVKNSLGAMVTPIINAIAPAVEMLADKFVNLLNTVNQVIAKLSGAKTWTKALKYPTEYAEAADDATDANKKLKRSILGFDEINALTDNSDSDSSKKKESKDYSSMFTEVKLDNSALSFLESFEKIGKKIAEKINSGLGKIKWNKIQKTAKKIAKNIGDLINGFVGKLDWKLLGKTIGEGINTAITFAKTFLTTVKWGTLGTKFADGLNSLVKTVKAKDLGTTIAKIINAPFKFAEKFTFKFDWKELGKKLASSLTSFAKTIDLDAVARTLYQTINGLITTAQEILKSPGWDKLGEKISKSLMTFVSGLNFNKIADVLAKLLKKLAKTAQTIFQSPAWSTLGNKLREALIRFFKTNPLNTVATTVRKAIKALFDVAINLFSEKNGKSVAKSLATDFAKAINNWFSDKEWWSKAGKVVSKVAKGILDFLTTAIQNIDVDKMFKAFDKFLKSIDWRRLAASLASLIANVLIKVMEVVVTTLDPSGKLKHLWNKIGYSKKMQDAVSSDKIYSKLKELFPDALNPKNTKNNQNAVSNTLKKLGVDDSKFKLTKKASGGFVNTGQAFIARESGPELVGTIGNRTAVVNNAQIVDSVAQGVADANGEQNALLREQNSLLKQILSKEQSGGGIATSEVINTLQRKNRRDGKTIIPVGV